MSANSFGELFKITTFGESHGVALGTVIEGCPAGVPFDFQLLQQWMNRRKPGGHLVSSRAETDEVKVLSGIFEGQTLGTPIAAVVYNVDAKPSEYSASALANRKGHATDLWQEKFGHSDPRGSGRASGRETLCRVIGGAFAQMFALSEQPELKISSRALEIGGLSDPQAIDALLTRAKESGESYGGIAEVSISGVPRGLGQPVFHKLKGDFASALMGIGATTSIEIGDGLDGLTEKGTEFHSDNQTYGGIRGGISTGDPIIMKVGFKPTSTVADMARAGRHDPCIIPRALPVLESMCWLVMADHLLWRRLDCGRYDVPSAEALRKDGRNVVPSAEASRKDR